ncbi:MAG: cysteine-rich VLP domain-containing protein [Lachnospiraceae bacterium]|nr:cysteine-rich VLP domain-containing protein [Lachnospiraceae bacterium]
MLEDGDEHVCPQRISYSVGCRWFRNAVLPLSPELETDIFKDISLKHCVRCGTRFVPRSNRSMYCLACAAAERRGKDKKRKWNKRHPVRI